MLKRASESSATITNVCPVPGISALSAADSSCGAAVGGGSGSGSGVFVGSGIFKSGDPAKRARAIVEAVTHFRDADALLRVSRDLGDPMSGIAVGPEQVVLGKRGW